MKDANNPAWEAARISIGTYVRINEDAIIDAIRFPDGRSISSPYIDGGKRVVNSEEAKSYLGQVGKVIDQSFGHSPFLQMNGGAVVVVMYRSDVTISGNEQAGKV